ncbi:MAG TPA: radical SAM protein [Bacteroidales bacterium]|nr:radical SAM protein [Bacteroidales bacterium]
MGTFLFDKVIFGPVKSRRLGVSLGINLLPGAKKVCNFNCIYCECGWSQPVEKNGGYLPGAEEVYEFLASRLQEMKVRDEAPDVITFAGNGEPTLHPEFPLIIDSSIMLRNKFFPKAKIAVLSNATTITNPAIRDALMKADMNILKLDSAFDETIRIHNQPRMEIKAVELIENLVKFRGRVIIQTLFLRGKYNRRIIDNTTTDEINAWLAALEKIMPSSVMIYTISRDTPVGGLLTKVPREELLHIASRVEKLGIPAQVSA